MIEKNLNSTLNNFRDGELDILDEYQDLVREHTECPHVLLYNYIRTIRTQEVTKLMAMWEVFQKVLNIHGDIIEVGTLDGFNIFTMGHFSEILEPRNYTRKIYGFDTFTHYASRREDKDKIKSDLNLPKTYSFELLQKSVDLFNKSIQFSQFQKIGLVKGDAVETIPTFVEEHPETCISMLICHCGMYEPTKVALEKFYPRMPKGSIVLFGTLNYADTPGEMLALLDTIGISSVKLERLSFNTKMSYFIKE